MPDQGFEVKTPWFLFFEQLTAGHEVGETDTEQVRTTVSVSPRAAVTKPHELGSIK